MDPRVTEAEGVERAEEQGSPFGAVLSKDLDIEALLSPQHWPEMCAKLARQHPAVDEGIQAEARTISYGPPGSTPRAITARLHAALAWLMPRGGAPTHLVLDNSSAQAFTEEVLAGLPVTIEGAPGGGAALLHAQGVRQSVDRFAD